jgi:hypothetical protein
VLLFPISGILDLAYKLNFSERVKKQQKSKAIALTFRPILATFSIKFKPL